MKLLTTQPTLLFLCLPVSFSANAQVSQTPLFSAHSVIDVRIEAPLTTLMRERPDEEYLEGTFTYSDDSGQNYSFDLKLRTRGKLRRQKAVCAFAPIRLNFPTKQLDGSVFEGQDKLKLVTHCQTRKASFEQLVLQEFLAYRILQQLTDKSFGARLMRVTYVDTERADPFTRYGFVIEDEDDIGKRLDMEKHELSNLRYDELDASHTNLINVYEYLLGNTDFSLIRGPEKDDCCHNATPYSDGQFIHSVPYDFDVTGLVDAPYAEPNPRFKIRNLRTRVYRGRCSNNDLLPATLDYFLSKEAEILALVDELPDLKIGNHRKVTRYLEAFFADISEPKQVERKFIRKCS